MRRLYSTSSLAKRKSSVYRMYDKDGKLLYVGCSISIIPRAEGHRIANRNKWWKEVRMILIDTPRARGTALEMERMAIENEKPKYNATRVQVETGGALKRAKK